MAAITIVAHVHLIYCFHFMKKESNTFLNASAATNGQIVQNCICISRNGRTMEHPEMPFARMKKMTTTFRKKEKGKREPMEKDAK